MNGANGMSYIEGSEPAWRKRRLCDLKTTLSSEVSRNIKSSKTFPVSFHLLVKALCRHALEPRQIRIEDHLLASKLADEMFDASEFLRAGHCKAKEK